MPFVSDRALLIYNPHAGFQEWSQGVAGITELWRRRGWRVDLQPTQYPGHAVELARRAADQGVGLVLIAGGDGSLNEVANGLAYSDTAVALLPAGTANSFAREIGLPRPSRVDRDWLRRASDALLQGRLWRMDLGQCLDGRYWVLWASAGADSFVVDRIEPRGRHFKRLGVLGYGAKALWSLPGFPGMRARVQVDEQAVEGEFVMVNVSNCQLYAGGQVRLNTQGRLDDGLFEVWLFPGRHWLDFAGYVPKLWLAQHVRDPRVQRLAGRSVTVSTQPVLPYHLDGEPAGATPLGCTLRPGALRILAPATPQTVDLFGVPGEPAGFE